MDDYCLLLLGSQNANELDRKLERDEIKPVQYLANKGFKPIDYFNRVGSLGISSMAFNSDFSEIWWATTSRVFNLDLKNNTVNQLHIERLKGIHEMFFEQNSLWISNTFYDEVIEFCTLKNQVIKRIELNSGFIHRPEILINKNTRNEGVRQNKFHCNQVFRSYKGELMALVHHVNGEQIVKKIAQKLIKSQGNGGVINLENHSTKKLALKAPHTVRLVKNQYFVFNSGHGTLMIFDLDWQLNQEINIGGWGRGASYCHNNGWYYCGISALRKRYMSKSDQAAETNMVVALNDQFKITEKIKVPAIEQINNLYCVPNFVIDKLLKL